MALVHPHPALRAAIPINAMVDGWMGDDWFHKGAFRQDSLTYTHDQEATRGSDIPWWTDHYDDYDTWLSVGSAGAMARLHGLEQVGFAGKLMSHPAYDEFWQDQAMDKILAKLHVTVPTMLVHSLWDQEDIYGNIALYKALKAQQADTSNIYLVIGPWFHHQQRLDGSAIGQIRFGSDTAEYFRKHLLRPFFDHYLKDDAPPLDIAQVTAFETGTNHWERLSTWPSGCGSGCSIGTQKLYLQSGGTLRLGGVPEAGSRAAATADFDSYVSDPAKPVPYIPRPVHIGGEEGAKSWQTWLVSDQRDVASRTDVLSFSTPVLTEPLKISGEPIANLIASTSGSDGDFVVKLIDVYPDELGREPRMGGYQLMVSADILRGRYRDSFSNPKPIPADQKQVFRFALPTANHVFLPGHRIMVQVQSSWFPLYDRNPQTYVDNIFFAKPGDYKKATIKIYDGAIGRELRGFAGGVGGRQIIAVLKQKRPSQNSAASLPFRFRACASAISRARPSSLRASDAAVSPASAVLRRPAVPAPGGARRSAVPAAGGCAPFGCPGCPGCMSAVLAKLTRLSGMLRGTWRHIRPMSTHNAWRVECAGSRGCRNGRVAAVRSGAQGRIARRLLHMRVLRGRRRYVLFGTRGSLLRSG